MNLNNFDQRLSIKIANRKLDAAKQMGKPIVHMKKGQSSEAIKRPRGYKRKNLKFPIDDYKYDIHDVNTQNAHVSINGRTGLVTVKFLKS